MYTLLRVTRGKKMSRKMSQSAENITSVAELSFLCKYTK